MDQSPRFFHRRSIRLQGYDYSQPGGYFITLVTDHRAEIFGSIVGNAVQLSVLGQMVREEWFRSGEIRKEICLYEDEFVVMPNHIHGIVWIVRKEGEEILNDNVKIRSTDKDGYRPPKAKSLAAYIAGYKAVVTSRARRDLAISTVWQRSYYEHILRSEKEHQQIWNYIDANPQQWLEDQLHPCAPPNPFNQS